MMWIRSAEEVKQPYLNLQLVSLHLILTLTGKLSGQCNPELWFGAGRNCPDCCCHPALGVSVWAALINVTA